MQRIKTHHIISTLAIAGLAFVALTSPKNNQPLFSNLENFVLFAEEEITLEQGVQISSGDIGSNNKLDIQKEIVINGKPLRQQDNHRQRCSNKRQCFV